MALVIEDGTGKIDSTSYVTVDEARAYALARGVTLPVDDNAVEAMLINAADYLEAQRALYQGSKTYPEHPQAMQWPRTGVIIDCDYELPEDQIPSELKKAQMQCCIEIQNGFALMASTDGRVVKRTKVDVIEKEFFSSTERGESGGPAASFPAVDALLAPLYRACGAGGLVTTVRV